MTVGSALRGVLSELDLDVATAAIRIHECWPGVVGDEVARHATPVVLRGPVLEVQVDSSVWCQQLMLRREEILAGLRQALGDDAPSDLRLRLG